MIIRFVEFAIPFMVIELDGTDLGKKENETFPLVWSIQDFVEVDEFGITSPVKQ